MAGLPEGRPESLDRALGALIGAACGDAVGAYLEFQDSIKTSDVDKALTLPGGGCWNVGPGQFTDDTELALCQAQGLAGHLPSAGFPADAVAQQYAWWCNASRPFDVGITTRRAFSLRDFSQASGLAERVRANAAASVGSKANGATMRATPLAIWAHRLDAAAVAAAAADDASLSHPSEACRHANAAYVLACAALIRAPGDAAAALAADEGWAQQHACAEVRGWLAEAWDDAAMERYDAAPQIGFVKHALCLAFHHLRRRSGFEEGLRHTLLAGGDTDTNAAIVCGLLGALHGASAIPADLRQKVEGFEARPGGAWPARPEALWGRQLAPLAEQLYREAVLDAEGGAGPAPVARPEAT
ncbi:hypothetical protein ABPG75_008911 [Micractinium tetrahymenae]